MGAPRNKAPPFWAAKNKKRQTKKVLGKRNETYVHIQPISASILTSRATVLYITPQKIYPANISSVKSNGACNNHRLFHLTIPWWGDQLHLKKQKQKTAIVSLFFRWMCELPETCLHQYKRIHAMRLESQSLLEVQGIAKLIVHGAGKRGFKIYWNQSNPPMSPANARQTNLK